MAVQTNFRQDCPSCGRALRLSLQALAKTVRCEFCGCRFQAHDPAQTTTETSALEHPLLLVHSDRDQLARLTRRFAELGYQVTPVFHPRQALEASTFKGFRVALIDERLPEIDGVELARRLQRRVPDLLVVLFVDDQPERPSPQKGAGEGIWMSLSNSCPLPRLEAILEEAIHESQLHAHQRLVTTQSNASNDGEQTWLTPR